MTRWRAGLGLLTLVLAVSGCGRNAPVGAGGPVSGSPGPPFTTQAGPPDPAVADPVPPELRPPVWVDASCPPEVYNVDPSSQANRGRLPAEFVTAWVLRCRTEIRDVPGQGKQAFRITERADTPAAELVAQLRRPSEPRTTGMCAAYGVGVPYFALVGRDNEALLPAVPNDECGRPRREALQELQKLSFVPVSETPAGQAQSQTSVETGCPDKWKDMLTIEADRAKPGPARPLWPGTRSSLRVCVYDQLSGKDVPGGQLRTGRAISGPAAADLLVALDKAGPAAPCALPHSGFAVLTPDGTNIWAMAELDGCHRLLRPDNSLGQLDDRLVALLS